MYVANWGSFTLNQTANHSFDSDDLWTLKTLIAILKVDSQVG